ncbi:uncharacterized protein H6S33_013147 [Morchella sextelata]|uniref:uncharacterized protein n=1 Tax=Morchella sextelata TaxID=1174677 RepID=UPI001D0429AD|nr:uncharacterized protein H6S33_013147 [Morchella sextelata]KAH0609661.1 hypothetical protein H6S33_013147 [Morchella sextelata]
MSSLKFVLSASAAQRVHDILSCLSKFSEYVCLEARRNRFTLSALNSTKSAYGGISLSSGEFFESYSFEATGSNESTEPPRFTCRLYSKALLAAFRQRYSDSKGSSAIDRCEVSFEDDPSRPECRILVQLVCGHGVLKTYKLTYEEVEVMAPVFDKGQAPNRWTVQARLMKEYMEHFGPKAEGLDITSNNGRAVFTSFTEKVTDGKEILKLPMHTSIALDTSGFDDWSAEDKVNVAISLKDMKAIIMHAASLNTTISTFYSEAGRPFQVTYDHEGMRCQFTLMTMTQVSNSQTFAAITRVDNHPTPGLTPRHIPGPAPRSSAPLFRAAASQRDSTQSQQAIHGDYEESYRPQTQPVRTQLQANRSTQRILPRQPSPQAISQVLPSQHVPQGLFLPYDTEDEDSDDDDLGKGLEEWEPRLRWDSGCNDNPMPSISVVRDQIAPGIRVDERGDGKESEKEEEEEDIGPMVGPTQQVSQVW